MDNDHTPLVSAAQPQVTEDAPSHSENTQTLARTSSSGHSNDGPNSRDNGAAERVVPQPTFGRADGRYPSNPRSSINDFDLIPVVPPPQGRGGHGYMPQRRRTLAPTAESPVVSQGASGTSRVVSVDEKSTTCHTVGHRLLPVIENAMAEKKKYDWRVKWTGWALNIAIGLQVFLGAMTTALAAALTNAQQAKISTALLGGLSTLVASYLARARGSGEPELSVARVKDLEQFLRECRALHIDHGHECATPDNGLDYRLDSLRRRFEELLGNINGEKKTSFIANALQAPTQALTQAFTQAHV